ncbi:MAG: serine hydrolase domain-containing protein [Bacteroidota bacterium]
MILISITLLTCDKESNDAFGKEKIKTLNYLERIMGEEGIPGLQVAIIKNNEIVLSESLGLANVPFSVDVKENTIFPVCSISKIFAATAILQLEEQKKLTLLDPISKHIPTLPSNWNAVTIEQLLSNTSGLPDIEDPNKDELVGGGSQDSAWVKVQEMPLQFRPGEEFSYNATNYLLIQKIIEEYGETSYEEFIKTNQFKVAGMEQIIFANSFDVKENKCPTYIYYYRDETTGEYVKGANLLETNETFPTILRADAGAFSSASEMAKWVIALQSEKLIKRESINKMWAPAQLNNGEYGGFGDALDRYALGWPVMNREKHAALVAIGGGRAALAIYPEDDLVVILLTNLTGLLIHEVADEIAEFYYLK